ncbi:hypothetical protein MRB53_038267 [Persea americana]|nr:hypothetical protein MRB53_038267 [Persea americana]
MHFSVDYSAVMEEGASLRSTLSSTEDYAVEREKSGGAEAKKDDQWAAADRLARRGSRVWQRDDDDDDDLE